MHYEDIQGNVSVKPIQPEIDVALLLKSRDALRPSGINDRPVKTQVFRISNFQKIEMPASAWGHFSSAESYLISYAYRPTHSYVTKGVAYLYQGLRSSTIEKGTAAMLTVDLAKECEDNVTQIRIEQGKEPLEFALLFGYTLVSFYDEVRELSEGTPITFDVRMSRDTICRAIQVSSVADICAPVNNVIVFCFSSNAYIWIGSYSVDEEKACATALARRLGCHSILEFEEPDFSSLDKALSSRMIALPSLSAKRGTYRYLPRFFTASGATGIVEIEELHSFTGQDLFGVCILDVLHTVYIWINEEVAKPDEKRVAIHAMMVRLAGMFSVKLTIVRCRNL